MAASKTKYYSNEEIKLAQTARALSHPARVRILSLIKDKGFVRNCDLMPLLRLDKNTIHHHLIKLKDAELVRSEFNHNSYLIVKQEDADKKIERLGLI